MAARDRPRWDERMEDLIVTADRHCSGASPPTPADAAAPVMSRKPARYGRAYAPVRRRER